MFPKECRCCCQPLPLHTALSHSLKQMYMLRPRSFASLCLRVLQALSTCNFVACPTHPKNLSLAVISGLETPVKTKTTGFGCSAKQSLSIKRRLIFLSGYSERLQKYLVWTFLRSGVYSRLLSQRVRVYMESTLKVSQHYSKWITDHCFSGTFIQCCMQDFSPFQARMGLFVLLAGCCRYYSTG